MNHPVLTALAAMDAALDEVAGVDPMYMSLEERKAALVASAKVRARADALELRLMAASDDVAAATGDRSTAAWVARETRDNPGAIRGRAAVAAALDKRWAHTAATLEAGGMNLAQARVVAEALDALPAEVGAETRVKAESFLVTKAAEFGPRDLARLGACVLEAIAPEIAEAMEYQQLLASERRGSKHTRLFFRRRGDGTTDIHARLPDRVANRLRFYLDGYTSPRNKRLGQQFGDVDNLPLTQRRGLAFWALLENLPAKGLPRQGGTATTVSVKIDLDKLVAELAEAGVAVASTGDRITAGEARRLACQAGIVPHVMGAKSVVLDQGRKKRLHDENQRLAIHLNYDECATLDCTIPVAWTEIHHPDPWSEGGTTDLDGIPLCPFCHHRAHDPAWETTYHPNGDVTFHRRQ